MGVRRSGFAMTLAVVAILAAVSGGIACGGCAPREAARQVAPGGGVDAAIEAAVRMSLKADPRTQASAIDVAVSGRVVTLTGEAASGEAKLAAVGLAERTPDVVQVIDRMTVKAGGLP